MPNYFASLPAPEIRNALLNFAPVNNALESVRDQNNANRNALLQREQMDMRKDEQTYQRGRDAKQDDLQLKTVWGKRAQAVFNQAKTDPQGAAATWKQMLSQHPNPSALGPEYMDVNRGPSMIMAEAGIFNDPRDDRMKDLELQYKQGQIDKLQREPMGGNEPAIVQTYKFRQALPEDQRGEFDRVQRAQQMLDTGTTFVNARTGAVVPKNLVDAEAQKELGTAVGKQAAAASGDLAAAETALELVDSIRNDPNRAAGTSLLSPIGNAIPKTPGYAFQKKVDQAKAGAFLTAIQQLRGMGALSNAEGQTATSAVTRMETATQDADFEKALEDYEKVINRGQRQAQKAIKERERLQAPPPSTRDLGDGFSVEFD